MEPISAKKKKIFKSVIFLAIIVALYFIAQNLITSMHTMMVIDMGLAFTLVAFGVSVMLGMGGELSFAGVAFMGGGAFLVANFTTGRLGFSISPIAAFLLIIPVFTIIGYIIGLVMLRLKGAFFTFSSIALVQVAFTLYNNYKPLFGGADGIAGVPTLEIVGKPIINYYDWFTVLVILVIIVGFIVERIRGTQLGRALACCRDNETAARTLGVNVYQTKVIAFMIAAVLSAMAGGIYTLITRFASADMFTYVTSTKYVIMAMLGGVQSTLGSVFGALLVQVLPQIFGKFEGYLQLFWGFAIVLLMIFMPEGFAGLMKVALQKIKNFKGKNKDVIINDDREKE